jgi:hypothetical protein
MEVAKVDRDVAHVAYFCKCFRGMLQALFKMFHLSETYVVASVLFERCICFTHMLQLLYLNVAFISHMLQVFYLDVAFVSHICCNNMFQIFHLCQKYVASKYFMLQVFHEDR